MGDKKIKNLNFIGGYIFFTNFQRVSKRQKPIKVFLLLNFGGEGVPFI